ncbi:MAG TPA: hypothetical protein VGE11_21775 [Pseudonocardia sp.]
MAFGGVRLTLAGHAPRGVLRRVPAVRRWSTSCPFCRAALLTGPAGVLPAHLRPQTLARCGGGSPAPADRDVMRWGGMAGATGAAVRSW